MFRQDALDQHWTQNALKFHGLNNIAAHYKPYSAQDPIRLFRY